MQTFKCHLLRVAFSISGKSLSSLNPAPPSLPFQSPLQYSHYPAPSTFSLCIGYLLSPGFDFQTKALTAACLPSPFSHAQFQIINRRIIDSQLENLERIEWCLCQEGQRPGKSRLKVCWPHLHMTFSIFVHSTNTYWKKYQMPRLFLVLGYTYHQIQTKIIMVITHEFCLQIVASKHRNCVRFWVQYVL